MNNEYLVWGCCPKYGTKGEIVSKRDVTLFLVPDMGQKGKM